MKLNDNIIEIKGIGEKTTALFAKLNIYTINDLIHTMPRDYLSYNAPIDICDIEIEQRCAIFGTISSYIETKNVRNFKLTTCYVKDGTGTIRLNWFNSPYLKNVFHKGERYIFVGTVKYKNNMMVMDMPEYYRQDVYQNMLKEMQPVYSLTEGLSNKVFQKSIIKCMDVFNQLDDFLTEDLRQKYNLMPVCEAFKNIHFPSDEETLKEAIKRIAFDEFYKFIVDMDDFKNDNNKLENNHRITQGKNVMNFIDELPFKLTKGQSEAIEDVLADMGSEGVMNRLIQGDVGSGKTVVAEACLFACAMEGYQGALMAPTEVLAKQHFAEIEPLFNKYGIKTACLVGSTSLKEKRHIYEMLKNKEIDVIVGTHAIIEDKVVFNDLGLVVTDEQHRFGVNQRKKIASKGNSPHVLVMSATPIPRTLAMIMYADLDISVISEMPKGRKPIKNCVVGTDYRNTAYRFIKSQVELGNQAYVICPMVDESDTMDLSNVVEYTEILQCALGNEVKVSMLHGQMKASEKNEIMEKYLRKEIDVLVSTTVIEVGINNPNSTVMMVENAERFGLATLHQLRGRVGRGSKQSYCIFICTKRNSDSLERLKVLENSNDGFYIASEDLKLRGPGDFWGIRQSGDVLFRIADIYNHADMLRLAQDIYQKYGNLISDYEEYNKINKNIDLLSKPVL